MHILKDLEQEIQGMAQAFSQLQATAVSVDLANVNANSNSQYLSAELERSVQRECALKNRISQMESELKVQRRLWNLNLQSRDRSAAEVHNQVAKQMGDSQVQIRNLKSNLEEAQRRLTVELQILREREHDTARDLHRTTIRKDDIQRKAIEMQKTMDDLKSGVTTLQQNRKSDIERAKKEFVVMEQNLRAQIENEQNRFRRKERALSQQSNNNRETLRVELQRASLDSQRTFEEKRLEDAEKQSKLKGELEKLKNKQLLQKKEIRRLKEVTQESERRLADSNKQMKNITNSRLTAEEQRLEDAEKQSKLKGELGKLKNERLLLQKDIRRLEEVTQEKERRLAGSNKQIKNLTESRLAAEEERLEDAEKQSKLKGELEELKHEQLLSQKEIRRLEEVEQRSIKTLTDLELTMEKMKLEDAKKTSNLQEHIKELEGAHALSREQTSAETLSSNELNVHLLIVSEGLRKSINSKIQKLPK
jgi:hypothetical protein